MDKRRYRGFTLVEIAIVLGVISILASILIPTFAGILRKSRSNTLEQRAQNAFENAFDSNDDVYSKASMRGYLICVDGKTFEVNDKGELIPTDLQLKDYLENGSYEKDKSSTETIEVWKPNAITPLERALRARDSYHVAHKLLEGKYYEMENYIITVYNPDDKTYSNYKVTYSENPALDGKLEVCDTVEDFAARNYIYKPCDCTAECVAKYSDIDSAGWNGVVYVPTIETQVTYRLEKLEQTLETEAKKDANLKTDNFMFLVGENIYKIDGNGKAQKISHEMKVDGKVIPVATIFGSNEEAAEYLRKDGYEWFFTDSLKDNPNIAPANKSKEAYRDIECFAIKYGVYTANDYYPWSIFPKFYGQVSLSKIPTPNATYPTEQATIENYNNLGYSMTLDKNLVVRIVLPDQITTIGDMAFRAFPALTTVVISESVNTIVAENGSPFPELVKDFRVNERNKYYADFDNNAIIQLSNNHIVVANKSFVTNEGGFEYFKINDSFKFDQILGVGNYAFENCTDLTLIDISDLAVGKGVFKGCTGLTKVVHTMNSIPDEMFRNCSKLSVFSLTNNTTSIGAFAFENCELLAMNNNTLQLTLALNGVGECAFSGAVAKLHYVSSRKTLAKVPGAENITNYVGVNALSITYGLKDITYVDGGDATYNGENITTYAVNSGVEFNIYSPTRYGYEFLYWDVRDEDTNISRGTITSVNGQFIFVANKYSEDLNVIAIYEQIIFDIEYHLTKYISDDGEFTAEDITNKDFMKEYPKTYNKRSDIVLSMPKLVEAGYRFNGWRVGVGSASLIDSDGSELIQKEYEGNLKLYGILDLIQYTIEYNDYNGGKPATPNRLTYSVVTPTFTLNEPLKDDYTFNHWEYTKNGNQYSVEHLTIPKGSQGDLNMNAIYVANEYRITYEYCKDSTETQNFYGAKYEGSNYPEIFTVESPVYNLGLIKRMGYTFDGWIVKQTFLPDGVTQTNINTLLPVVVKDTVKCVEFIPSQFHSDTILLAKFTTNIYSIIFGQEEKTPISMGGQASILSTVEARNALILDYQNPTEYSFGTEVVLNSPTIKTGYTFIGWSIKSKNNEVVSKTTYDETLKDVDFIDAAGCTLPMGVINDLVINAVWELDVYKISYNLNGGTTSTPNPTKYTVEDPDINIINPTKIGYDFTGWTGTGISGSNAMELVIKCSETFGDKEFEANWKVIVYKIEYILNDSNNGINAVLNDKIIKYTIEYLKFSLPKPTRNGYDFDGWTGGASGPGTDNKLVTKEKEVIIENCYGDRTYEANWVPIIYTITYDMNDLDTIVDVNGEENSIKFVSGKNDVSNPLTYTVEDDEWIIKEPTRIGYTFDHWEYTENGKQYSVEHLTIPQLSYGDKHFKVYWSLQEYTIWYKLYDTKITLDEKGNYDSEGTIEGETRSKPTLPSGSSVNPIKYNVTSEYFVLENPVREGYIFMGWTSANGNAETTARINKYNKYAVEFERGTDANLGDGSIVGDMEFEAIWEIEIYTITYTGRFVNNAEYEGVNPTKYTVEDSDITVYPASKVGYKFDGWTGGAVREDPPTTLYNDGKIFSSPNPNKFTLERGSTGNRSYEQNWTIIYYDLTVNCNYDNTVEQETPFEHAVFSKLIGNGNEYYENTYTIESDDILLKNITQRGYTFKGWTGFNGIVPQKDIVIRNGSIEDRKYNANWDLNIYSINYEDTKPNNYLGTFEYPSSYTVLDTGIIFPDAEKMPAKGYLFRGWTGGVGIYDQYGSLTGYEKEVNKVTDGFTLSPKDDASVKLGDRYYLLNWELVNYTMTFVLNNNNYSNKDNSAPTSAPVSNTAQMLTKFPVITVDNVQYPKVTSVNGIEQTITYIYNVETATYTMDIPSRLGYNFKGWDYRHPAEDVTHPNSNQNMKEIFLTFTQNAMIGNVVYNADWEIIEYALTYMLDDETTNEYGDPIHNPTHTNYTVEDAITIPDPIKTFHRFDGWTGSNTQLAALPNQMFGYAENAQYRNIGFARGQIGDKIYYAHWTLIHFTISYMNVPLLNDPGLINTDSTVDQFPSFYEWDPNTTIIIEEAQKHGYNFAGWDYELNADSTIYEGHCTVSNGDGLKKKIEAGSMGNLTFTAKWEVIEYAITYEINTSTTGIGINSNINDLPSTYTIETATTVSGFNAPGYTFKQWDGGPVDANSDQVGISAYTGTSFTIAVGSWGTRKYIVSIDPNKYVITFNRGGATNGDESIEVIFNEYPGTITLPSMTGYRFLGYFYNGDQYYPAGSGTASGLIRWTTPSNATMNSSWEAITYNIYLYKDTTRVGSLEVIYMEELPDAPAVKEPAGYTYKGYYTEKDGGGTQYYNKSGKPKISQYNRDSDINLYQHWELIVYTISYTLNGGSASNPTTYTVEDSIKLNNPTRAGYTFTGWTGTGLSSATKSVSFSNQTGNRSYTANWKINGVTSGEFVTEEPPTPYNPHPDTARVVWSRASNSNTVTIKIYAGEGSGWVAWGYRTLWVNDKQVYHTEVVLSGKNGTPYNGTAPKAGCLVEEISTVVTGSSIKIRYQVSIFNFSGNYADGEMSWDYAAYE